MNTAPHSPRLGATYALPIFAIGALCIATLLLIQYPLHHAYNKLKYHGEITNGEIDTVKNYTPSHGTPEREITYTYATTLKSGKIIHYTQTEFVPKEYTSVATFSRNIRVVFDPDAPSSSRIDFSGKYKRGMSDSEFKRIWAPEPIQYPDE